VHNKFQLIGVFVKLCNDDAIGLILQEFNQLGLLTFDDTSINHTYCEILLHEVVVDDLKEENLSDPGKMLGNEYLLLTLCKRFARRNV
jgi:hypothetical protein